MPIDRRHLSLLCSLALLGTLAHCQQDPAKPLANKKPDERAPLLPNRAKEPPLGTAAMAGPSDLRQAEQLFAARCQMCHGPAGRGDGPMAAMLTPKPRSFAEPGWQQKTSDQDIAAIILRGGAAVGRSPAMPAMPELSGKPNVLAGLVKHVRRFGQ